MWILNTVTPVSELGRMTQFKDKSARQAKNINTGLFTYPVLQAADILLYRPDAVPVGHDQKQHLELTNDIARKINAKFGEQFSEVKPLWTKFPRVMSLKDPTKKMSKSDPAGCLFLDDEPEAIREKLKKAVTATDSSSKSSGAANLMLLLAEFGERAEVIRFTEAERDGTLRFSEVKEVLAERVAERFAAFRAAKRELLSRPDQIAEALGEGARRAQKVAAQTMLEVKEKIGLL
jgi:tryptophanyl-tRNA synthetase